MKWRCKSRDLFHDRKCEHHCIAECNFEPEFCLIVATHQEWEKVGEENESEEVTNEED